MNGFLNITPTTALLSESSSSARTGARHPLTPLDADEIDLMRAVLEREGLCSESTRFAYLALREPAKADILAWEPGVELSREAEALLTDLSDSTVRDVVVDLTSERLVACRELDPRTDGFGAILDEDYVTVDAVLKADPDFVAALRRRGVTDLSTVRISALSSGAFEAEDTSGIRTARALPFVMTSPADSAWAHPVGGLVAHVDLTNRRTLRIVETPHAFVPAESGDYLDPAVAGPPRTTLKPITISQPEGVSFSIEDSVLTWENWTLRIGYNGREGLTLHQVAFADAGRSRPVLYRGSISEMVVNYGDPSPTNAWQNYFDVSEYQFGRLANQLELGCDCLGEITYLDAVVADDFGRPVVLRNAVCIHEEDYGVLWKHTDPFSKTRQTRRQRRLVVSFFVTVGNYDYGFYWYLYLDGTIQLEAKATGIVFANAHPGGDYPYSTEIAPGLGAPIHQHLFSARLDVTVDGIANAVNELEVAQAETGATAPWGNAFTRTVKRLARESQGMRDACNERQRVWQVISTEKTNRFGHPTSYVLYPEGGPALLAAEDAPVRRRARFAGHHLWVTRYERDELWAAGRTTNQNPAGGGLPSYIEADRSIDGEDIVLWHTFGLTHFVRTEDWPIMPVDYAGFTLKPSGFFDRNPTLDVPDLSGHCGHDAAAADSGHGHHHHH